MIKLTTKQQEIVDSTSRYISVIAGAGSGKTRVITSKISKSIVYLNEGQKILGITFSNKASEELKERLIEIIDEDSVSKYTYIGTIHNLCNDILMSHGHLVGINDTVMICSSNEDKMQIFRKAVESVPSLYHTLASKNHKERQATITEWLDFISKLKRNLKFASDYDKTKSTYMLFKEFDDQLINQGMIDFDDIVRFAYKTLISFPSVLKIYQRIYKEIYVDEAQDINLAQYEIIKLLAGDSNKIIMVGDPNQAIYGFSGGSPEFLNAQFEKEFEVKRYTLDENFRSSKSIIDAANILETSFKAQGIYPIQGEFIITPYNSEEEEAVAVVNKITSLINEGHPDLDDVQLKIDKCAVIARNRYVFSSLIKILNRKNINYSLKVSPRGSFSSESDVMRVFELGLILLGNKLDIIHLDELNQLLKTSDVKDVFDIEFHTQIDENDRKKYNYVISALKLIGEGDVNLSLLINKISKLLDDETIVIDANEKELIQEDINFWKLNWQNYVKNSNVGERNYSNFIRKISLVTTSTDTRGKLTLTTVHMSKGLEYDTVFVIGLNDGVFPDYRSIQEFKKNNPEPLNEEKHNMFVAITRAKRLCYLSYPLKRMMPWGELMNQAYSRFLKVYINPEK